MRFLAYTILLLLTFSCKKQASNNNSSIITNDKKNEISNTTGLNDRVFKRISSEKFVNEIEKNKEEKLPFFSEEGNIISKIIKSKNSYSDIESNVKNKSIDSFLTLDLINEKELFFDLNIKYPKNKINFKFLKRFPPLSEDLECLLFSSSYNLTQSKFWVVATYNKKSKEFINIKTIAVFEQASDMYYKSGIYINENYEVKSSFQSYYESPSNIRERKLKVFKTGEIKTIYEKEYYSGRTDVFYDYVNDYEIKPSKKILHKEDSRIFYDKLINQTPKINLPYSSDDLYRYMRIYSPKDEDELSETILFYNKLELPEKVEQFITKNKLVTAFKKVGNEYKKGEYFYPIFQFNRTKKINVIAYLYQSFCNNSPAIYVKLVSYDNNGDILDELIVDRRFFSGDNRVFGDFDISEKFKIKVKRYSENFESYGYEGYEENDGREKKITKENYQITWQGNFIKKDNDKHYSNSDTIYYTSDSLKVQVKSSKKGGFCRVKKEMLNNGTVKIHNYSYSYYKNKLVFENLISVGFVKRFEEIDLKETEVNGKWLFYDDNGSLHQIGNYQNGLKNGIWYTIYEDASLPKIEFYKNGNKINYKKEVIIIDEKEREWIKGSEIRIDGIPNGEWEYYNYEEDTYNVINYSINANDSIKVISKKHDLKTKELIKMDQFNEEIDSYIYKNK